MKKIISTILLITLLSSCSLLKEEKTEITSSGEIINIDENNMSGTTLSGEIINIDENGNVSIDNENNDIKITTNTETDVSVEKDIENIIDTNNGPSKDSVTEEEILNDIDTLINDIIKSAENG